MTTLKKIVLSLGISLLVVGTFTEEIFSLFGVTVTKKNLPLLHFTGH
jgi:hypothetical protein